MLDGLRVVAAGLLSKSLKVVYQRLCLVLANACGSSDVLHVEAARFLVVIVVIVSHGWNPLRTLLSPLLAALGILDGDIGWHHAATGDHFPAA
jgi:hypothetical protein